MEPDPKKQEDLNKSADQKIAQVNPAASSPVEQSPTSLDDNIDKSIVENKPQPKTAQETVNGAIRKIRTYKEDIAEAVRSQKASLTSITAAEQNKRSGIPKDLIKKTPTNFKKIGIIFGSVLFIAVGVGLISFFVFFYEKEEVVIQQEIPSFLFVEKQVEVDVTEKSSRGILQALGEERITTALSLGQISQLYLTETTQELEVKIKSVISAEDFLTKIRAQVSDAFLRSLDDSFMVGVHVFNQNQPFIIFKSNSYQHSFAGLLEWERVMYNDLFLFTGRRADPILGVPINPQTGKEVVLKESFEDRIIQNIDVRALTSEDGEIELLYAFPNQQTLIVTTNENTLIELITRINSVRVF